MSRIRPHLSFANVVASLALFIALGAGAYAAGLPRNSVKSKQIKTGAVKTAEVADGSLIAGDFAAGQLPAGARGATGEQGPQGLQGLPGDDGDQGAPGTARAYVRIDPFQCTGPGGECTLLDSKGITAVTHIGPGNYCVRAEGINASNTVPALAVDLAVTTTANPANSAVIYHSGSNCPTPTDLQVRTTVSVPKTVTFTDTSTGTVQQDSEYSDVVGFGVVIP